MKLLILAVFVLFAVAHCYPADNNDRAEQLLKATDTYGAAPEDPEAEHKRPVRQFGFGGGNAGASANAFGSGFGGGGGYPGFGGGYPGYGGGFGGFPGRGYGRFYG